MTKPYPGTVTGPSPDPTTYAELVAEELSSRKGERVHLQAIIGGDAWVIHDAVEMLRELGWVITGERGKAGYTYERWERPRRWQRIERICRGHVAALSLSPPRPHRQRRGQLELEGGEVEAA